MATRDDIPTDIALEIDEDLEPSRFVAAVREFFGLTEELARMPGKAGSGWRVKVREGSNIIALAEARTTDANASLAALNRVREGTQALVNGDLEAPVLTEKAIQHAKKLSDLTKDGPRVTPMRIWLARHPILYGPDVAEFIRQDEAASYNDYGTLEGTLRVIADQSGSLVIRIHDPLWPSSITCRVRDEHINDALAAFRKRVEVAGIIHYNRLGRPISINMESLTVLPDDSALPSVEDVRGILSVDA